LKDGLSTHRFAGRIQGGVLRRDALARCRHTKKFFQEKDAIEVQFSMQFVDILYG